MQMMDNRKKLRIDRGLVQEGFRKYTAHYDPTNGKVALKIAHTYRVAKLCDAISDSIGLEQEDKDIAWLLGMLHDVGRFEQVRRFDSFFDAQTVDHAKFGADLLFGPEPGSQRLSREELEEGPIIGRFVPGLEEAPERALIELAIRVHNDFRIPEGLTEREQMFCNIIRDADKVDIFRVNLDYPVEVVYNTSREELEKYPVAEAAMEAVREHRCVLRTRKESPIDNVVGHICLAFELVYPLSLKITLEQGYLDRLLNFETRHPKAQQQFRWIREEMDRYIVSRGMEVQ